ncbi:MAG: chemotaxis protein CheW [Acidobacteriota bacterium]
MAAPAAARATVAHLLVSAGGVVCGVPLDAVRRVVRALAVQPLPGSSRELLGLAEFAGEPLPVLDLAALVAGGTSAPGGPSPVTVVVWAGPQDDRELVGLAVEAALEVRPLEIAAVVPSASGLVRGEVGLEEAVVRVLDLRLLGSAA